MGPAPRLGAHAHCATNGAQARAKHRGPGTGLPQRSANALHISPYNGLADSENRTVPDRGRNLRDMVERYPPGAETARAGPPRPEDDPSTISMLVLESGDYYQVWITPHQQYHWNQEAVEPMLPASAALPDAPSPLPQNQPQDLLKPVVSGDAGSCHPGACPLLPLALGSAPLAAHQGLDSDVEVPPGWPTATGGHPRKRANDGDTYYRKPVPRFRDPLDPGVGAGRTTAAHRAR